MQKITEPLYDIDSKEREAILKSFLYRERITCGIVFDGIKLHKEWDDEVRACYKITLKKDENEYTFQFGQSIYNTERKVAPTALDVLYCLNKIHFDDFEDFRLSFGYNRDAGAYWYYEACKKEYEGCLLIFGEDGIEELSNIVDGY
jgi:hypothetical protein